MNKINKTIITQNIKCQLDSQYIAPIVLSAPPGIGKTSTIRQMCKDLNLELINVSCGNIVAEELSGIPDFKSAPHFDKYSTVGNTGSQVTEWSVPGLIQMANKLAEIDSKDGAVILLDDLHELNMSTSPYMLEFLLERKLGQFKLADKVAIVSTMNDSEAANFSGMSSAMRNRLAILDITFDFENWFNEHGKHYHFYISSFLKTHPAYVQEEETTGIEGFATPRAYNFLSTTFESFDLQFIQENASVLGQQYLSKCASAELKKHIAYIEAIDFTAKINVKQPIDIKALKPIEQILYAYIINYVDTIEDAEYVMDLIDSNIASSNFIGFIVGELYTKFLNKEAGKPITDGLRAIIEKLLNSPIEEGAYTKLTKKDKELYDTLQFKEHDRLFSIASEFIH